MFKNLMLNNDQFHGITSEILDFTSELGSVPANLMHHLAYFGACVGRNPHVFWRGENYANLSVMLVAGSADGKGESQKIIQKIYNFPSQAYNDLLTPQLYGTIPGSKFVSAVQQILFSRVDGENRLLNIDEECNARFKTASAWNSSHDETYCKAFDGIPMTGKWGRAIITLENFHFGSIGHITPTALKRSMKRESFFNGFVNRSIWIGIPKQDFRESSGVYDEQGMTALQNKLAQSILEGSERENIKMTEEANNRFIDYSRAHREEMQEDELLSVSTQRLPQLCLKVALILCLCNREERIDIQTMDESIVVMDYYKKTMTALCGNEVRAADPTMAVSNYLAVHGATSRTDLIQGLSGSLDRETLDKLLQKLVSQGIITCTTHRTPRGRFPHFYELAAARD